MTKFKVWDKKEKCMAETDNCYFLGQNGQLWDGSPFVNLQYMGFKLVNLKEVEILFQCPSNDKDNNELFEGDVVEGTTYKEPIALKTSRTVRGIVKKNQNTGEFYFSAELPGLFRTYPALYRCKKLGNIYENPELLERK